MKKIKENTDFLETIQKYLKHRGLSFELTLRTGEIVDIGYKRLLEGTTLWKLDDSLGKKAIDLNKVIKAEIYAM